MEEDEAERLDATRGRIFGASRPGFNTFWRKSLAASPEVQEEVAETEDKYFLNSGGEVADDARYDAMTPEQREKYYVHPNLWTRFKKMLFN
jgi:hypothetical protein